MPSTHQSEMGNKLNMNYEHINLPFQPTTTTVNNIFPICTQSLSFVWFNKKQEYIKYQNEAHEVMYKYTTKTITSSFVALILHYTYKVIRRRNKVRKLNEYKSYIGTYVHTRSLL